MKIQNLIDEDVVTTLGDISLKEAISILYKRHIGSIIIIDKDKKCKGIFTERDAIRVIANDIPLNTPLVEVMTTNLKTVDEQATFSMAKEIMRDHNIRHLPVVDEQGRL
ncbi:MAG: CBS domain-containing protein, partial [Candidatus Thorarchaeota archaeon]|nr:CBS domain-containing protein [Candidatus Thorarchaeota archaeon]